ncbi:two-component system, OmpR family, alkaline phosphatase synthesis response regulator PhoP [Geoalkalibacter ferrihydriticus]|uniref:Chemotaxis protein CheY n=2 Tax=Geoalkalibacter ferrihydriticus TaxID=392333 RepID=A0A0C2HLW5_9BACT|nr:response regulator transcription factor [Geoalkalibacter ferrihydriticus]KIH78096.1 chemotaxis protein CheY [Geoalkalibacter ferrihydriticus DSM 17813]SDM78153.1 two-component system, OmpR family, alkaline phosphatase synthesis response regulator PhoP [Geoalkalibacter ferrihydriticus]
MSEPTKLLAIDDDPDILRVLKANLGLHGFSILTAETLMGARRILELQRPALVLLDLMLPDGDGLDFCREIKERHPLLPVIMLTAKDQVDDKVTGLEIGADDYMVKPFETSELLARIRARLRQPPPVPPSEVVVAGDLEIDLPNHQVRLRGEEVSLTPKEFQLLSCLVAKRNQLVTREEIRRWLWKDSRLYSWSRVIDVHTQHLRQKIEDNAAEPRYIVTVMGQGYRFEG